MLHSKIFFRSETEWSIVGVIACDLHYEYLEAMMEHASVCKEQGYT